MVSTETLLLVLLSTGLLFVLVLASAVLWVVLTILFRIRHNLTSDTSADKAKLLNRVDQLTQQFKNASGENLEPLIHEGEAMLRELEDQTRKLSR